MKRKIWKQVVFCGIALLIACSVFGCSKVKKQNTDGPKTETDNEVKNEKTDGIAYPVEKYLAKISNDRKPVSECAKNYQNEVSKVQNMEYQNLDFSNCKFFEFPKINQVELIRGREHGITAKESWNIIKAWLKDIGKYDKVDMKKEVFVVCKDLGLDKDGNYFTLYDRMDELEKKKGVHIGPFISNNLCHIQLEVDGMYSMSNGKITEYLGEKGRATHDAMGAYAEDVVESGAVSGLEDKTYQMIDKKISVKEAAQMVKEYFENGTPFPCADGVTVEVPEVSVFKIKDVYGYDFMVRRVYNTVPFAYMDHGSYEMDEKKGLISSDIKHAYVVDSSGVAAFAGYNEAERLEILDAEDSMIGFGQAIELIHEKMAPYINMEVNSAGLVYLPMGFQQSVDKEERIIFPCWELSGTNQTKGEGIKVYADAITGELYYYTWREE